MQEFVFSVAKLVNYLRKHKRTAGAGPFKSLGFLYFADKKFSIDK